LIELGSLCELHIRHGVHDLDICANAERAALTVRTMVRKVSSLACTPEHLDERFEMRDIERAK